MENFDLKKYLAEGKLLKEGMEFDEDNWKDLLGSKHAFVEIASKIPTEVEAIDDYVMITVNLEDLKGIVSLAEGRLLKEDNGLDQNDLNVLKDFITDNYDSISIHHPDFKKVKEIFKFIIKSNIYDLDQDNLDVLKYFLDVEDRTLPSGSPIQNISTQTSIFQKLRKILRLIIK